MSTKESKAERVTRLFEEKVVLDELDLEDLKFVSLHIQQAYIHTNLKGAKKAKGDSKPNAFFQFRSALTEKVKELDLPSAPTWLSQFAGYLYTNKNWKEDTDKLEDEDELTRLHARFADKNPIPEKKAKAKKAAADDSEDEAPKAKKVAKKVPVDSEDDEPKPKAKAAPKKEVKVEESEDEEEPKAKAKKEAPSSGATAEEEEPPKPKAKAKVAPKVRMTPEGGGEVQTINGVEYYTAQDEGKLKVWTTKEVKIKVKEGKKEVEHIELRGDEYVGVYNFKTKEIDTEETKEIDTEEEEEDEE